jgi:hypothetical protein
LKPGDIRVPGLRQMVPATRRVESYYNTAAEKKSSLRFIRFTTPARAETHETNEPNAMKSGLALGPLFMLQ